MTSLKGTLREEINWRIKVFDSLLFPSLILTKEMLIVAANQIFLNKMDLTHDEVVGKSCHEIFYNSKEPCPKEVCPFSKVISHKKAGSVLRAVTDNDGEVRWEDRVFSPIFNDDGGLAYIMESVRDVTFIKKMEREFRETKEFLEKVIESSASGVVASTAEGNILLMNPAAEELFGYSLEKVMEDKTVEDLYPPGVAKKIMEKLRSPEYGGKGKLSNHKIDVVNVSGERIPGEISASIIYEGEREVATMGIYTDLRERLAVEKKFKETESHLIQTEKMASMGQLAAGVAHEINNPLTGILFYASLLMEKLQDTHPMKNDIAYIIEDVNRCKVIVSNLLAYSRKTTSSKNIIQFAMLIQQSLGLIRDQKLFRNVKIVKEMPEGMMLVQVDTDQVSQAIINLAMNALSAMEGKGTLTLRMYRDKIAKKVVLEMEDTGCGIPKANLTKIFDPFFTTKEPGKGTGLGLSTSIGIIQENGGKLFVKETSSKGTTFVAELPLFTPAEA